MTLGRLSQHFLRGLDGAARRLSGRAVDVDAGAERGGDVKPRGLEQRKERVEADHVVVQPRCVLPLHGVVGEELDAARRAGMQTALADRPGNRPATSVFDHPVVTTFADIFT